MSISLQCTAVYREVPEGYIACVEELPGANIQGATLEEARANPEEAVRMVLEANRALTQEELHGVSVIPRNSAARDVKRSDLVRHLENHNCRLLREGGKHSLYLNPQVLPEVDRNIDAFIENASAGG